MGLGENLHVGSRVEIHPALDEWMAGDKFGTIVGFKMGLVSIFCRVKLDKSGRILTLRPDEDIAKVVE